MSQKISPEPAHQAGNQQDGGTQSGNLQSHAQQGENFVLVDSERGLDIGDDLFSIGEVRRADRLPRQHQGGNAGQSRQSADDAPDTTGSTGV
ncbi:hypothetical protein [Janthinobacterium psychrotolerans]|uniref:Uncharacterized protein n=1 Tax=Janthinobacterium psychrotolerans TaxID=1747903 RepID=A0A1A7BWY5_9BURK|nr:hypothetical protein [Janthinobacterium psychrotolerans]OBV36638.1 hypothetical protein ASR47_1001110 [Janthinobacterium psychrotolerans]